MTEQQLRDLAILAHDEWNISTDCAKAVKAILAERAYVVTRLKAHCDSRTNPGDHGLAFELLKEMGERHEADKH